MPEYFIGVMSGTSIDGIDAVLADFGQPKPNILQAHTFDWPEPLAEQIINIAEQRRPLSLECIGETDVQIGEHFAYAVTEILAQSGLQAGQISAIGSHGQTVWHAPDADTPFSLQLGDANRIAEITGITTVADFRRRDIAAGGQGAPLVPAFHQKLFQTADESRVILNIGGFSNVTILPANHEPVTGFDTGPGNVLLDAWYQRHWQGSFDHNGDIGRIGTLQQALLEQLIAHPYFLQQGPKSTGRETFCLSWLEEILSSVTSTAPENVQRTLVEFTARTITDSLTQTNASVSRVMVCGGGTHNGFLMQRLAELLTPVIVETTEVHGLHPDWVEATAFAWLAKQTLQHQPGNLPTVTGARHPVILGAIYSS